MNILNEFRPAALLPLLTIVLPLLVTSGSVQGASQDPLLASADAERIAKVAKKCVKCHGDDGISDDTEIPHLAGQSDSYLFKQLKHFKADQRDGGRMNKTIRKLDEQKLADLAVFYAAIALPTQSGVALPAQPGLVGSGDQARGIDACAECHGEDGRGKRDQYDAPALAGMPLTYFATSLASFADGSRQSDVDGVMGKIAKALSDDEVQSLAQYYLALGGRLPVSDE